MKMKNWIYAAIALVTLACVIMIGGCTMTDKNTYQTDLDSVESAPDTVAFDGGTVNDAGDATDHPSFTNPVAPGADPFILKDDGIYYLYATSGDEYGYRVYSSVNLVEWTSHGYCLLREDVYTDPCSAYTNYAFWAPEVMKYDGKYYLVYTAQHRIGVAVSDSPTGPFKNDATGYLINTANVIDGNFFVDDDGVVYLYFVTQRKATLGGYSVERGNNIWGCVFDMSTLSIKQETITLLVEWDENIETLANSGGDCVEGPFMIKHGGVYYMSFSSNRYQNTKYSVHYATSTSPLGSFNRDKNNVTLICDDPYYEDNDNPHLYGTGHHSFVEAPNGKDLLIVYHAHRTGNSSAKLDSLVSPRSTCIDLAWFTEDGRLLAGSKDAPTVPTATAQPILEGTELERETHLSGEFSRLEELQCVYVAQTDGVDKNPGTKKAPLKTLTKAFSKLTEGGTVILMQSYDVGALLELPDRDSPIMITAEHNNVIFSFKFIKIRCPLYLDNIILAPETLNGISVIECNFNDVVIGEGVSCLNRPRGERDYPYIVGGKWKYIGTDKASVYDNFRPLSQYMNSTKQYTLRVLGGTWQRVYIESVNNTDAVGGSTPNATLVTDDSRANIINKQT